MATRARAGALAVAVGLASSACYYGHLADGQIQLWLDREPVEQALDDPATPELIRHRLALAQSVRRFAGDLGLDVGDQYTSYVPWEGDRLVTTLVTTRPREVTPAGFDFPLLGTLPYKGFFDRGVAESEADRLRAEGLDVCVSPVLAYSSLGWITDPLTGPMLRQAGSDDELVETLVHELVHVTGYWPDDVDFSESVATFIGEEAAARFYAERGDEEAERRTRARVEDDRRIAAVVLDLRAGIEELYADADGGDPTGRRAALEAASRDRLAHLDLSVRDAPVIARTLRLSDACLALRGTYAADLPRHAAVLESVGGDLRALIRRLRLVAPEQSPRGGWFRASAAEPARTGARTPVSQIQ